MRFFLIYFFLFIFSSNCTAQQSRKEKMDSFRQIIYSPKVDTLQKLKAYNRLLFRMVYSQKDSTLFYLKQYKKLAITAKENRSLAAAYFYENKLLLYEGQYKKAAILAKKRLQIGQELNNPKIIARAYSDLGNSFQKAGELDSALHYYQISFKLAIPQKKFLQVRNLINISETYQLKGEYIQALQYGQEALAINQKTKATGYLPTIYGLLGSIYLEVEDLEKASINFNQAIKIAKENNNIQRLASSHELLAKCQIKTNNYALAETNLLESIRLGQQTQILEIEGRALWKLAALYLSQNKIQKALTTILKSEQILVETNNQLELINCLRVKGTIYNKLEDYTKAKKVCLSAQQSNKKTGQKQEEMDICYCLYEAYNGLQNSKIALEYLQKHNTLKDSIMNFAITRKITQIEYQKIYDSKILEDSIATINQLAQRDLTYTQKAAKQQRFLIISIAIASLLFLFLLFITILYNTNKKKRAELEQKNEFIEQQKSKIQLSLEEKNILLKEIHHRVKNNLQTISGLLQLQARTTKNPLIKNALNEGQSRIKSMALIHQKLYQTDDLALVNLHDYLKELTNYLKGLYPQCAAVNITFDIQNVLLDIDTAIPIGLIINEMLSNSFKYAFDTTAQPQITLKIIPTPTKGNYQLHYKDNGIGLPENFDIKKAKSLGLKLIRRLTQQLLGNIQLINKDGLTFIINFMDTPTRDENG